MAQTPEEDTSPTSVTQGGRKQQIGNSIWWVLAAAVIALAVGFFSLSMHKHAPAEHNTTTVSGGVGMAVLTIASPSAYAA